WHRLASAAVADSTANAVQLRAFAATTYDPAATTWLATHTPPATSLTTQLQALTGLPAAQWFTQLNQTPLMFRSTLVAGAMLGRYDARVAAPAASALGNGDPSINFIAPQFNATIGPYLRNTLGYSSASAYVSSSNAIDSWDFQHDGSPLPDVIPDLAA